MRGMLKMYDELESTNDLTCSGYMLNNKSNNNAIHLECLLSTHVCACVHEIQCHVCPLLLSKFSHEPCWFTHETSQGFPRHASRHRNALRCFVSPPASLFKPCLSSRASSLQNGILPAKTASIWILSETLVRTSWLQVWGVVLRRACLRYVMMNRKRHRRWRSMMTRNRRMRGMLKTYDELESTNDLACSGYMLLNNSNNNAIHLERLLSTHVCTCVHGIQYHVCPLLLSKFSHEPCWFTHETSQGFPRHASRHRNALRCFVSPPASCLNLV